MNQQDYFKVVYGRDKTALKKEFVDKIVTETEKEDINPIELRMRVRSIKAQYKQDKKALKHESKRLEKGFRKEPCRTDARRSMTRSRLKRTLCTRRLTAKIFAWTSIFRRIPSAKNRPSSWIYRAADG